MKAKKTLALLVACVLIASLAVVGCASESAGGVPEEYYELTLLWGNDPAKYEEYRDVNSYRQYLKDHFNFGYNLVMVPGDMKEKLTLMLAGGDYPDIVSFQYTDIFKAYVEAGALLEFGPLMEQYAPNTRERCANFIPYWKAMSGMDDGKIWGYTGFYPYYAAGVSSQWNEWIIRSDILEQQGYPVIKDENDLYEVLAKGLTDNPKTGDFDTVGFAQPLASWGTNGLQCITYSYNLGRLSHDTFRYGMVYDYGQSKFIDVTSDYSYKDGLAFINKLWNSGLYDRDAVTDDYNAYSEKMSQGRVLSGFFYIWDMYNWNVALAAAGKDYRYVPIPFMLASQKAHGERKVYPEPAPNVWCSFGITKNAKYPERIMEVINWQHSEEGMIFSGWGEEGVNYTVENGLRVPTESFLKNIQDPDNPDFGFTFGGIPDFGGFNGIDANGQSYYIYNDADLAMKDQDPKILEIFQKYGFNNYFELYNNNPNFGYAIEGTIDLKTTMALTDDQAKAWEKIDAATHDYTMKLITAPSEEAFNAIFAEMQARRNELGQQELIAQWNKEYPEKKAALGIE